MSAMIAPRKISRVPCGRSSEIPTSTPCSASIRNESSALTASAPTTAPHRLVSAADHEHRQGQEGELEVDLLRRDRPEQVHEQRTREAGQRTRDHEGPEPFAVDVHAHATRRRGILAGGAQRPPESAALVDERSGDDDERADRRLHARPSSPGTSESVVAPGPILVHSRRMLCVTSSTAKVAMPAASPESRISGSPTSEREDAARRGRKQQRGEVPDRVVAKDREELRKDAGLRLERDRHHSRRERADGDEADLAEREDARVADEDVDRDDDRDRDERVQEVDLVRSSRRASSRCQPRPRGPRGRRQLTRPVESRLTRAPPAVSPTRRGRRAGAAARGSRARTRPRAGTRSARSAARR